MTKSPWPPTWSPLTILPFTLAKTAGSGPYTWAGAETFKARLVTTRISNEEYTAVMFITKVGSYEDFIWYEGTLRYDRTHAEWTMYHSPQENVEWLSIEWNRTTGEGRVKDEVNFGDADWHCWNELYQDIDCL